ncbi:MAG: 23S rRNA (uracil(1939)-C(5))-methyltransferase RlmD [Bacteroidota bacterium]
MTPHEASVTPDFTPTGTADTGPASPTADAVRRGASLELDVTGLAFGGAALSKVDGLVVFVENALPGDRVLATVYRRKRQYAEARADTILRPSPARVIPRCEHVPICGGCRFQELDYAEQLRHKERQVEESLAHLGGLSAASRPAIPAPSLYHYRNKMEFSFGRDFSGTLTLGLHRRGFFDRSFDLARCHIARPIASEIVAETRAWALEEGLEPYDTRRHVGLLRFLVVREGIRTGEVMVNLVASAPHPSFPAFAERITRRFPAVASVVLNLTRRKAQVAVGEEERVLAGRDRIEERLGGLVFEISSGSFFQTNTEQGERLIETALEGLALTGAERVLDVYSGTGTFTLPIARRAREAVGIESSEAAVRDAGRNAARNGIENARFIRGEAAEALREEHGAFDAVLVDPPRAGLHPGVIWRLVSLAAPRLVYVSCNPATLGRDLALLCESRYRLSWVRPVDMFPHTPHIECVAALGRATLERSGAGEE